ncbi:LTA synthase family protein [Pelobium manganitolerans]|uniref:LTA synthase family protein n=1 Tax=Pelobium manganitolerans TaxID=1842495 RepID=UPI003FA387FB
MLKSLSFFIKYFLFWLVFFILNKLAFELWNADKLSEFSAKEIFNTFYRGALMDMSMAGYFCALPFLYVAFLWLFKQLRVNIKPLNIYTIILIVITAVISVIDVNIYREWGSKINYKAIDMALDAPAEALASTASSPTLRTLVTLLLLMATGIGLYKLCFKEHIIVLKKVSLALKGPTVVLLLGLTFLAIRGSISVAPMNTSRVYFSNHQALNIAAINTNWFLISDVLSQSQLKTNPYIYFSAGEAKTMRDSLFVRPQDFPKILKTETPNVVLIIIESFTADVIKELGPEQDITPNFSKLIKEGLLFTNIYSASDRTDKGLVATLSAFPSQATESIIKQNEKQMRLPAIPLELNKKGYHNSFIYGGDLNFANFKSYLMSHGFTHVKDQYDIKSDAKTTKWGFADEVTAKAHLEMLNKTSTPFFSTFLTLSNHEPFYLRSYKFGKNNVNNMFRSTSFYTDSVLYDYVQKAKKQSWYQNTLFIMLADHGHRLPTEKNEIFEPGRYHIPLLFFGGALKEEYRDKKNERIGSQVDLASTLLQQLNCTDTAFHYSKNLLAPDAKSFAFYSWNNGFGMVDSNKRAISFDPVGKRIIYQDQFPDKKRENHLLKEAKALMQLVFTDYMAW